MVRFVLSALAAAFGLMGIMGPALSAPRTDIVLGIRLEPPHLDPTAGAAAGVGAGVVTTVLIPWLEAGEGLSRLAEALLERAFAAVAPLQVTWADDEGFPVDFLAAASRAGGTFTAVVSNNDEARWRGNVTIAGPDAPSSIANCAELRSGAPVPAELGTMHVNVGGFDVAVVQCDAVY